jgi:hypothetical protein
MMGMEKLFEYGAVLLGKWKGDSVWLGQDMTMDIGTATGTYPVPHMFVCSEALLY